MLHLRLTAPPDPASALEEALLRAEGLARVASAPATGGDGAVLEADLQHHAADDLIATLEGLGVRSEDYLLSHIEVIAPIPSAQRDVASGRGFAWVEVLGEARVNARPLGRYHALMAVAGVVAALGVIKGNAILIVGAMAVSPDLLPLCATCVALVGRRVMLARRALTTLATGLALVGAVAAALTALLDITGLLASDFVLGEGGLGSLAKTDYSTVIIALAAGVAAMLSFETRASAAVGVAISVTTIPASAYWGVAVGAGEVRGAGGALLVLAVNVCLLIVSGSATLAIQRRFAKRADASGIRGTVGGADGG